MPFKKDFIWGVATASYQIEGAWNEDGKSPSIWDTFTHRRDRVRDHSDADVACDSYHKVDEDIELIKNLGVKAYRFSLAWTRIIPSGVGEVNPKGVDYYNRLIDGLIENGIEPYITLYHWDLPQCLQDRGGFLNPNFPEWFKAYARVVVQCFGDRVKNYFTFNEPQCIFGLGHNTTIHAPGLLLSQKEQLQAVHNMLLAHGYAVKELRKINGSKIGYASCGGVALPIDEKYYKDAYETFFKMEKNAPLGSITLYADPIFKGKYPENYYTDFKDIMPDIKEGDMELISQPLDFFAQNCYDGYYISAENGNVSILPYEIGSPMTPNGWHITPEALYFVSRFLYQRYGKPIIISENGTSLQDFVFSDGKVHDPVRAEYTKLYLDGLEKAADEGVDVAGYFHWSLIDNFEWAEGYCQRFGLVYVDYKTGERIPKDSYYFYKKLIEERKNER